MAVFSLHYGRVLALERSSCWSFEVIPTVVLLTGVRPESELLISRGCAAWHIYELGIQVCPLYFILIEHCGIKNLCS